MQAGGPERSALGLLSFPVERCGIRNPRDQATTRSIAFLRGLWRPVYLRWAGAQQPQQLGGGHSVEVPDADHQAREVAAPGEFVGLGASDAEDPRGGHQVEGRGQVGELADGQRDGVDGILLNDVDSGLVARRA